MTLTIKLSYISAGQISNTARRLPPSPQCRSSVGSRSRATMGRLDAAPSSSATSSLRRRSAKMQSSTWISLHLLWKTIWHVLEPQDPLASAHGWKTICLPSVCRHVQAKSPPTETPVLSAPRCHSGTWQHIHMLLLFTELWQSAGAHKTFVRATQ